MTPIVPGGRDRVDFDSNMVTISYLLKTSSADSAKYYLRRLMQEARFVARLHGLKVE